MEALKQLQLIKQLYGEGKNIMQHFRSAGGSDRNSTEAILVSYDFQAGSYVANVKANPDFMDQYSAAVANVLKPLGGNSIMEAGVGEATTISNVLTKLDSKPNAYGYDLSWSRISYGVDYANEKGVGDQLQLFTGDLFQMPLVDNAVDIVYTSHSIEPNGGREREALEELYRVAARYVVLLEPCYELGSEEARARMKEHGYVTTLKSTAEELGYKIVEHRLFDLSSNPLNPTGLLLIEKDANGQAADNPFACPVTRSPLENRGDCWFAPESLLTYPIIQNIPCLLPNTAILASHFEK